MTYLTTSEQDYLNRRYRQPTCTCGNKMVPGWNRSNKQVYHVCDACRMLRKRDGTTSAFIYRIAINLPNDPLVCTCGNKMTLSPDEGHMQPHHECRDCDNVKFQKGPLFKLWKGMGSP
jgi:hypothetical protein